MYKSYNGGTVDWRRNTLGKIHSTIIKPFSNGVELFFCVCVFLPSSALSDFFDPLGE